MKRKYFIGIFIFLIVVSCTVKHVTSITTFSVEGRVFDSESKQPLEHVHVYFIDKGYDSIRSKKNIRLEIGQSDASGEIKIRLNYFWAYERSILLRDPERIFDIVLSKESYETKTFYFEESQFEGQRYTYFVRLEDVYMLSKNKD